MKLVQTDLSNNDLIHYNNVGVITNLAITPAAKLRSLSIWNDNSDDRYDYFDRFTYNRDGSIKSIQRNCKQLK